MRLRRFGSFGAHAALWCAALTATAAAPVLAQPARLGLVVGNSAYQAFPPLPACLASAQDLAKSLRGLGFEVIERQDATGGGLAAAINELGRAMESAPGASVVLYFCGYTMGMNERPFLLPVSASIGRPSDIMTQGILVKTMVDLLLRGNPSRGLLALDLASASDGSDAFLSKLTELLLPEGTALIAAIGTQPASGTTPLAAALSAGLADPDVDSGSLVAQAQAKLQADPSIGIAALRIPSLQRPLAVDDPPPRLPAPVEAPPVQAQSGGSAPERTPEPEPAPAVKKPPPPALPEEPNMTDGERRRIQEALARIGYYPASVDGIFGPETRAAIRRFQHEIGVEMTGVITGEQAARLLERH
jgi:hypothetical protein